MTTYIIQFCQFGQWHNYKPDEHFAVEFVSPLGAERVMNDLIKLNAYESGNNVSRYAAWQIKDSTGKVVKQVTI